MARSLENLQKVFNTAAKDAKRGMMMGPPRRNQGPKATGKPKNAGKTIKRLLSYVRPYRGRFILVLLFMLMSSLVSLAGSYMMAPVVTKLTSFVAPEAVEQMKISQMEQLADRVVSHFTGPFENMISGIAPERAEIVTYIITAIVLLAFIYVTVALTTYLQSLFMLKISQGAIESIRNDLFKAMEKLPVRFFDRRPVGEIMSSYTNDIDNIDTMLNNSLTAVISGTVSLVGTFIFMVTTNVWLTLVTVAFVPIFSLGGLKIAKMSSKYYGSQQAALGAVNGYIEETVTGQKVVKVFNHEDECEEEFGTLNNDMREKQFKAQFWGGIMGPIMGNMSQISYAVTVGVGGILMCLTGFTTGAITVFAGYSRQFSMPINNISQQTSTIFAALAGAERAFAIMDERPESEDVKKEDPEELKGYVVMKDVSFGYVPEKTVLKHIDLYAKPGQKIAFVGSTGAGKTTVTNLLNRFYDIEEGEITIDGIDIRNINKDFLRKHIAMVLQDTHLFKGTVMENIRYGRPDATDEEVIEAAKTASAHSFIMKLGEGYDTLLEGDGQNLSQGQRQLLNIARAAVSKAPILVLDEATSSVDTRTERHIERGMDALMKDRTTFVIAHRLSTVRNADAIMVLEKGEIIERGTHEQLLALKQRYYELYTGVKELD